MRKNKSGFTLLELIIVVIVIGILASIALPRYIRIAEKGRVAEAKALLGQVRGAQMRYSAERGVFTGVLTELDATFQTPKYFTVIAQPSTAVGVESTVVGTATRNNVDAPGGVGGYVINISQAGNFTNDSAAAPYM